MADTTLRLKVLLEAAGIKPTSAQLEKLNKKLRETAGATGATSKGLSNISKEANKTKTSKKCQLIYKILIFSIDLILIFRWAEML